MPTYAAGATVERRYPGPDADQARQAASPQIDAFVRSGFSIQAERWEEDLASGGAPIGDAIASGSLSQLAGRGGSLVITYVANVATDLPVDVPAYTLTDPRRQTLQTWSQLQLVVGIVFLVIFLIMFLTVASTIMNASSSFNGPRLMP